MNKASLSRQPDASQLAGRVVTLQEQLRTIQQAIGAEALAARTGCEPQAESSERGKLTLRLWGQLVQIDYPEWVASDAQSGEALPVAMQALLLYYFVTADGKSPEAHWISFADLPDGRFYNQAFQGYSGNELARSFQNDLDAFERATRRSGGVLLPKAADIPGDRAFLFQALPRLALLIAYWSGDEDFPAAAQILFEITAPHYLPTDVCAILGSTLTRRLIKQIERK